MFSATELTFLELKFVQDSIFPDIKKKLGIYDMPLPKFK